MQKYNLNHKVLLPLLVMGFLFAFPVFAAGVTYLGPYKDGPGEMMYRSRSRTGIAPGDLIVGEAMASFAFRSTSPPRS